jgi:hypothetical protein
MALAQAPRAPLDVFAVYCRIARHHVRACPSGILSLPPDIEAPDIEAPDIEAPDIEAKV